MRNLLLGALLAMAGTATAQPQPRRPAPPVAPTPAPALTTGTRPTPMYVGPCQGTSVFITSKDYRECCLLCSVGDDSMSKTEVNELEKLIEEIRAKNPTYVNIDVSKIVDAHQSVVNQSTSGRMSAFTGGRTTSLAASRKADKDKPSTTAKTDDKTTKTDGGTYGDNSAALPKF